MAKILEFVPAQQRVFQPEQTQAISDAFDQACALLDSQDRQTRQLIPLRIIRLARAGVFDASVLRGRVVDQFRQVRSLPTRPSSCDGESR
jgi:hypothetical protein